MLYKWVVILNIEDFNCVRSVPYLVHAESRKVAKELAMDMHRRNPPRPSPDLDSPAYVNQVFGPFVTPERR